MRAQRLIRWIRTLTPWKYPAPPNPLRQQMSTTEAIETADKTERQLVAELQRLNELLSAIRDEDWRPRHD